MTIELTYLTLTLLMAASLWIPFIVGVNKHPQDGVDSFERPPPLSGFPGWVHRAHRAHLNLIETAMPFSGLVLLAHVTGVSTLVTVTAATAFFWLRAIHAVGMISGIARMPARPLLFVLSWLCTVAIGVQVLVA
jgi:uncharacterized MAPEG superfamily protein